MTLDTCTAVLAVAAMAGFASPAQATIHAVAMYMRTGERTPLVGPDSVRLTGVGAQQAYSQGAMFRSRYIDHGENDTSPFAPINNMPATNANPLNAVIAVPENQYSVGSAQAFMQAFYPPHEPQAEQISDLSMLLSDSSVVESPLNGYNYPMISTASPLSPNSVFISGTDNCNNWALSADQYTQTDGFAQVVNATSDLYGMVGIDILDPLFPREAWYYGNAYYIYDFVRYQYEHNTTVFDMFNDTGSQERLSQLRWLADQHEWATNGDLEASGSIEGDRIRAVAGQTLAAKLLGYLQRNIASSGTSHKFNLVVGDYDPMVALFSLLSLPNLNSNFYGIPEFGSVLVFELFSIDGDGGDDDGSITSTTAYPDTDKLWVRFYFRNSTDYGQGLASDAMPESSNYQAYPVFARGPSETDMTWSDFEAEMARVMLNEVGDWCETCAAYSVFCPAFETGTSGTGSSIVANSRSYGMAPAVAGAVGAAVTLGVALLAFLVAALLGVRFTRRGGVFGRGSSGSSDLGGFKGSAKLASDQDLSIAKNGAAMGGTAAVAAAPVKGHERVGSWELREPKSPSSLGETLGKDKDIEAGWGSPRGTEREQDRPSFEGGDEHGFRPMQPRTGF